MTLNLKHVYYTTKTINIRKAQREQKIERDNKKEILTRYTQTQGNYNENVFKKDIIVKT